MTRTIETIASETLAAILGTVPTGLDRAALEAQADGFHAEARREVFFADNHDWARGLDWKAESYRFAAEARYPKSDDERPGLYAARASRIAAIMMVDEGYEIRWTGGDRNPFPWSQSGELTKFVGRVVDTVDETDRHAIVLEAGGRGLLETVPVESDEEDASFQP